MKCCVFEDLLPEYVENMCSEGTKQEMDKHMRTCESCREKMKQLMPEADKMEEKEMHTEAIQPFKKIKRAWKKDKITKVVALVLLVVVCVVFGTLTVGQIFPSLPIPSYDSLMYRYKAAQIAGKLVDGDINDVLRGMSRNYDASNPSGDNHEYFFKDVSQHITQLYGKTFQGKDVDIRVDGVIYGNDYNYYESNPDIYKQENGYSVNLTLRVEDKDVHMRIDFDDQYRYLLNVWTGEGAYGNTSVSEEMDKNSLDYNILEMENYLIYYYCACKGTQIENTITNLRISANNSESIKKADRTSFMSLYFTKDCHSLGTYEKGTYETTYSMDTGLKINKILMLCKSNQFQLVNDSYNTEKKAFDATLFWRLTDADGKSVIMTKKFYYGVTGYEVVDDTELICAEEGVDSKLTDALKNVFT